jgi:hypothetical protein
MNFVVSPVSDVWVSRDLYMIVLGFQPVLDLGPEHGVIGAVRFHTGTARDAEEA